MHLAQHGWDRDSASAININNYHLTWLKSHPPKIWSYWRCFIVLFIPDYIRLSKTLSTHQANYPTWSAPKPRCFTAKRHAELQICTRRAGPQSPNTAGSAEPSLNNMEFWGKKAHQSDYLIPFLVNIAYYPWVQSFYPISKPILPYFVIGDHGNSWNDHPMDWISVWSHRFHSCRLQAVQKSVRLQHLIAVIASRRVWLLTIGADHQQNPSAGYPWVSQRCGVVVTFQKPMGLSWRWLVLYTLE